MALQQLGSIALCKRNTNNNGIWTGLYTCSETQKYIGTSCHRPRILSFMQISFIMIF